MCGRIDQSAPIGRYLEALERYTASALVRSKAEPRYNVAPGSFRPLLHLDAAGELLVDDLHWGYQAAWAVGKVPVTINTRLEKITGNYWRGLLQSGRAIVPAEAWFEWTGEKGQKQPWRIHHTDKQPLFLAALANFGPAKETKASAGFTIVTADALGGMVDVHDRRPVVLSPADAMEWLQPDLTTQEAEHLARTASIAHDAFSWYPVNKMLSNMRNEGPMLIEPVAVAADIEAGQGA